MAIGQISSTGKPKMQKLYRTRISGTCNITLGGNTESCRLYISLYSSSSINNYDLLSTYIQKHSHAQPIGYVYSPNNLNTIFLVKAMYMLSSSLVALQLVALNLINGSFELEGDPVTTGLDKNSISFSTSEA